MNHQLALPIALTGLYIWLQGTCTVPRRSLRGGGDRVLGAGLLGGIRRGLFVEAIADLGQAGHEHVGDVVVRPLHGLRCLKYENTLLRCLGQMRVE